MAQCCVDLTELDTSASHFDLTLVHAAKILNPTTRHHAREITRGIRSLTVPREKRIGRPSHIAPPDMCAKDTQLSWLASPRKTAIVCSHKERIPRKRNADIGSQRVHTHGCARNTNGGFRGTIGIQHGYRCWTPHIHQVICELFATHNQGAQVRHITRRYTATLREKERRHHTSMCDLRVSHSGAYIC